MRKYGALITFLLAATIIFSLFHKHILNANRISFADGGDGIKSTFGMLYHIKHDSSFWHTGAMNYPFGESVFFTGNQVVLTNTLKLIKSAGWDLSDVALGISNLLILFSFVIAALFIYLIFKELNVDWWIAIPGSLIIILLSNQWERLGGHYNLAYAYVIPVILYLLLRFYRKPTYLVSVIFGILVLLFSAKQLYIAAFILILWIPYWIILPITDRKNFGNPQFIISHILIQFIVPFLVFNLFTGMHDPGLDRTAFPWGFYLSRIKLEAVFLPMGLPHGSFLDFPGVIRSKAYVGILSSVVFLIILVTALKRVFKKDFRNVLVVTGHPAFDVLFWAGVLSLLVAFGLPFSHKWERLLNYAGPFRQLRAVGRFVFPFYYVMTITSLYFLWKWYVNSGSRLKLYALIGVVVFTAYEAVSRVYDQPALYNNPIRIVAGKPDQVERYAWLDRLDPAGYQAIIPLPFFHVGSENYWMGDRSPVRTAAYASSLKSGLPLNAVMLSRTSISQTLLNIDLVNEPYHDYPILNELPDKRPFLLIYPKGTGLTAHERRLVNVATLIDESDELFIHAIEIDEIRSLLRERQRELHALKEPAEQDSSVALYADFSSHEGGYYTGDLRKPSVFFNELVQDTGQYDLSFWFQGTDRDLWPRSYLTAELYREDGSKYHYMFTDLFRKMVLRNGSWGLVEFRLHLKEPNSLVKLSTNNKFIKRGDIHIDNVLVRKPLEIHMVEENGDVRINNRQLAEPPQ